MKSISILLAIVTAAVFTNTAQAELLLNNNNCFVPSVLAIESTGTANKITINNGETILTPGIGYGINCPQNNNAGTQWSTFYLRATNFFKPSSNGDHAGWILRGKFADKNSYEGAGPVFHPTWGVIAEKYSTTTGSYCQSGPNPPDTPWMSAPRVNCAYKDSTNFNGMNLSNNKWYKVTTHVNNGATAYWVEDYQSTAVPKPTVSGWMSTNDGGVTNWASQGGMAFFMYCSKNSPTLLCPAGTKIELWSIQTGWL